MSILINKDTKVITQGITGKTGQFHTEKCREYANGKELLRRRREPEEGRREDLRRADLRLGQGRQGRHRRHRLGDLRAAAGAAAAIWEACEADLDLAICITEGIPVRDMLGAQQDEARRSPPAARKPCCSAPTAPA